MFYKNTWYLKEVIDELEGLGYHVDYTLLNAVNYDVPQNRERVVVIGSKQKIKLPNPIHKKIAAGEALGKLVFEFDENSRFFTESMDKYVANYVLIKVTEDERSKLHIFRKIDDYDDDLIGFVVRRLDPEQQQIENEDD